MEKRGLSQNDAFSCVFWIFVVKYIKYETNKYLPDSTDFLTVSWQYSLARMEVIIK